jgi:hypothetical protein
VRALDRLDVLTSESIEFRGQMARRLRRVPRLVFICSRGRVLTVSMDALLAWHGWARLPVLGAGAGRKTAGPNARKKCGRSGY